MPSGSLLTSHTRGKLCLPRPWERRVCRDPNSGALGGREQEAIPHGRRKEEQRSKQEKTKETCDRCIWGGGLPGIAPANE